MRRALKRLLGSPTLMLAYSFAARTAYFGLTLPLTLLYLSASENALWQVFLTVQSLQTVADLGLAISLSRFFSYAFAGAASLNGIQPTQEGLPTVPNWALIHGLYRSSGRIYLGVVLCWTLVIGVGGAIAVRDLIVETSQPIWAWCAWLTVLIGSATRLFTNRDLAFLYGVQRIALVRGIEGHIWSFFTIVAVVLLMSGAGLIPLVFVTQFMLVGTAVANRVISAAILKDSACVSHPLEDLRVAARVWPSVWRSGLAICFYFLASRGAALIYAKTASASEAASLLLAQNVMTLLVGLTGAPFYSRLPAIASAWLAGDLEECRALARRAFLYGSWAFAVGTVVLGFAAPELLKLAHSSVPFVPRLFWSLLGLAYLAERHGVMHLQLFAQTNRVIWHRVQGVTGVLFLFLYLLFSPAAGAYAIPIAQLLSCVLYQSVAAARHSHRSFSLPGWRFDLTVTSGPAMLILTAALFSWLIL